MKKKIAITGGIGSGKSTALQIIKELGFAVYSCDTIYLEVLEDKDYIDEVKRCFPNAVEGNVIDKKRLSSIVFFDKCAREQLNKLAHPRIMKNLQKKMSRSKAAQ